MQTAPHGDPAAKRTYTERLTYLPRTGRPDDDLDVPEGAEVLLEPRFPYLTARQIRDVLRTAALPSGYPILDGPEQWGRLDLYAAADGYGRFDGNVAIELDERRGGSHAADRWRNDIEGRGGLLKKGDGSLTLAGRNTYRGGTHVADGTLVAASSTAPVGAM